MEIGEIRKKSGKVGQWGNLDRLFKLKSFIIPKVQPDDLSFYQSVLSISQVNFSEVREKSGKMKVEKIGHPGTELSLFH